MNVRTPYGYDVLSKIFFYHQMDLKLFYFDEFTLMRRKQSSESFPLDQIETATFLN